MRDILKIRRMIQNGGKLESFITETYFIYLSMGAKLTDIDKRLSPSPNAYNIPSKMVEK